MNAVNTYILLKQVYVKIEDLCKNKSNKKIVGFLSLKQKWLFSDFYVKENIIFTAL